jgi:hypothetical protein
VHCPVRSLSSHSSRAGLGRQHSMITDYTTLQATIADYLNRDDLTSQIQTFIQLTEAQIRRRVRRKTVRNPAFAIASGVALTALPTDCSEVRSLIPVTGSPSLDKALSVATEAMVADLNAARAGAAGRPQLFAVIDGVNALFGPTPDADYTATLTYYQSLTSLSGTNTTNTVLVEAPDIYLFGALTQAAPFLEHDERIGTWKDLFDAAVMELDTKREREETAAQLHKARLPAVF